LFVSVGIINCVFDTIDARCKHEDWYGSLKCDVYVKITVKWEESSWIKYCQLRHFTFQNERKYFKTNNFEKSKKMRLLGKCRINFMEYNEM